MNLSLSWYVTLADEATSSRDLIQVASRHLLRLGWKLIDIDDTHLVARDNGISLTLTAPSPSSKRSGSALPLTLQLEEGFLRKTFGEHAQRRRTQLSDKVSALKLAMQRDPLIDDVSDPGRAQTLSIRDQAQLAIFYGALLGTDTHDLPQLVSNESLEEPLRTTLLSLLDEERLETAHWGVYRLGYRSGAYPLESFVLVHREHVLGEWSFDPRYASPQNAGHVLLDPSHFSSTVLLSEEERDELRHLASCLDLPDLEAQCAWQAIALVDLKHT